MPLVDGAHVVLYSTDAEADRAFLRDALGLSGIDVGGGWLTFALPPSEVAVHPSERNDQHELFFLCADIKTFLSEMKKRRVACAPMQTERWGYLTKITLPGGGKIGVYEPRHERASKPAPRRVSAATSAARSRTPRRASQPKRRRSVGR
ncbi:MAG TPA: hypothetical protein VEU77_10755 [Candidatus Acidoferrales bacterium]|nr:hypothetical protein [Candidatus Acidoferrales bacterium]